MTISPIPVDGFPRTGQPWNNITPFTYRDGWTYLEVLEKLREHLSLVIAEVNSGFEDHGNKYVAMMNELAKAVEDALETQAQNVNDAIAELENITIETNDRIVSQLVETVNSLTARAVHAETAAQIRLENSDVQTALHEETVAQIRLESSDVQTALHEETAARIRTDNSDVQRAVDNRLETIVEPTVSDLVAQAMVADDAVEQALIDGVANAVASLSLMPLTHGIITDYIDLDELRTPADVGTRTGRMSNVGGLPDYVYEMSGDPAANVSIERNANNGVVQRVEVRDVSIRRVASSASTFDPWLRYANHDEQWRKRDLATGEDVALIDVPGTYNVTAGVAPTLLNAPFTRAAACQLIVESMQGSVIRQEARQWEGDLVRKWEATYLGGTQRPWVEITHRTPLEVALPKFAALGDSLTRGYSDGSNWNLNDGYPAKLADYLGVDVINFGVSGYTAGQVNVHNGLTAINVKIPGGVIKGSGSTPVAVDQKIVGWPETERALEFAGTLEKANGTLRRSIAGKWSFERSGSAADRAVTAAQFRTVRGAVDAGDSILDYTLIVGYGRNDIRRDVVGAEPTAVLNVLKHYQDIYESVTPVDKRIVMLGTTCRTDDTPETDSYKAVYELRERLRTAYPRYFCDLQGYLTSAKVWDDTGITPTQADLDAQAVGMSPPSLFDDVTHYSRETATAVATGLIGPWMQSRGWA